MKKQVVTYEIALKLKELGFNEKCIFNYIDDILISEDELIYNIRNGSPLTFNYNEKSCQVGWFDWNNKSVIPTSAPLYQQVIDWLKEKYNIYIWEQPINSFVDDEEELNSCIFIFQREITDSPNEYDNKEQAILNSIKLIKN